MENQLIRGGSLIILGIDPGFAIVGYGVLRHEDNRFTTLDYGSINTDAGTPFERRLLTIHEALSRVMDRYAPQSVAVEQLYFNKNVKTALAVAQGRGAILLTAARRGLRIAEYTPLQVKIAVTGYGRADKAQIQQMVKTILNLQSEPKPDDVADALAVAICHAHTDGIARYGGSGGADPARTRSGISGGRQAMTAGYAAAVARATAGTAALVPNRH
jgi:crossover junction endodeoxyribonuclease RuvC